MKEQKLELSKEEVRLKLIELMAREITKEEGYTSLKEQIVSELFGKIEVINTTSSSTIATPNSNTPEYYKRISNGSLDIFGLAIENKRKIISEIVSGKYKHTPSFKSAVTKDDSTESYVDALDAIDNTGKKQVDFNNLPVFINSEIIRNTQKDVLNFINNNIDRLNIKLQSFYSEENASIKFVKAICGLSSRIVDISITYSLETDKETKLTRFREFSIDRKGLLLNKEHFDYSFMKEIDKIISAKMKISKPKKAAVKKTAAKKSSAKKTARKK